MGIVDNQQGPLSMMGLMHGLSKRHPHLPGSGYFRFFGTMRLDFRRCGSAGEWVIDSKGCTMHEPVSCIEKAVEMSLSSI